MSMKFVGFSIYYFFATFVRKCFFARTRKCFAFPRAASVAALSSTDLSALEKASLFLGRGLSELEKAALFLVPRLSPRHFMK